MKYKFMRFPGGLAKAMTLSYDDGAPADRRMIEILNRYSLKCTFNLSYCDEQTASIYEGHEIALHTAYHAAPGKLSVADGIKNVLDCKLTLEKGLGRIVRGMAYPDSGITSFQSGVTYEQIRDYVSALGVVYSRSLGGDNDSFSVPLDWLNWIPTCHHTNPKTFEYLDKFLALDVNSCYCGERHPRLFYMWGHSFEFENDNPERNWEMLERFCKEAAGRDDVWYATNMEIYEYITAFRSLVWSSDSTIVYNPTLFDVWFDIDGKLYCVASGETKTL